MSEELKPGVVYVCPERDIECGSFERNWCQQCPKRRATPPAPSTASEGSELRDAAQSVLDRYDELRGDRQPAAEFEILRAALASKQVAREVDVEAERKLYLKEFPSYLGFGWTGRQQDEFKVWLAARRTQEGAKDAGGAE